MLGMPAAPPPPPGQPSAPRPGATLADAGEFGFLDLLLPGLPQGEAVTLGPGDDAAAVRIDGGTTLVSTDLLVEGRHFRRDWAGAADVGHRAAAQSLSDLNAMGGSTTAITVGVAAPADLEVAWLLECTTGMAEECALVGASVVGGDLTRSDVLTLAITAVGSAPGPLLRRDGARPGDRVAVRGRLGWAAAGLTVLGRGFRSPRAVVEAYRRPQVPYGAGAEAAAAGATSMIDVSDGLLADLGHVADASGVAMDLHWEAFEVDEPLQAVAAATGTDPAVLVLTGGDDHALVGTFPPAADLPAGWLVVGEVTEAADDGPTVTVDGAPWDGERGWRHF
jgi:thiamine-monophosphate kinase